jgi:hypothetical protein
MSGGAPFLPPTFALPNLAPLPFEPLASSVDETKRLEIAEARLNQVVWRAVAATGLWAP